MASTDRIPADRLLVFYPGEIESRNEAYNRVEGLALPGDTLANLRRLAEETAITPGW